MPSADHRQLLPASSASAHRRSHSIECVLESPTKSGNFVLPAAEPGPAEVVAPSKLPLGGDSGQLASSAERIVEIDDVSSRSSLASF